MTGGDGRVCGPGHPRYIVAQRSTFPFGEWVIEYSVIDTGTNGNARTKCVVFEEDDAAQVCEALNFHHDLAVAPRADS